MEPLLLKEIKEQPDALARFLEAERKNVQHIAGQIRRTRASHVVIAARGTSDNAATYGKYLFASFNRLPVALATPSLYTLYHKPPKLAGSVVLAISQSGESPDILAVCEEARRQRVLTVAITDYPDSPLARAADWVILQHTGGEKTIAATKTFTTQLVALGLVSTMLAGDPARLRELESIPDKVARALSLDTSIKAAATRWRKKSICLVIGRGYNYATAFEIALKLKELAYVAAEPFSSADFMHGPIALARRGFPIILIAPRGAVSRTVIAVGQELKERGATLLVISDVPQALALGRFALRLPGPVPEWLSPLTSVIPGQLLAYHLTLAKGLDPDHPRGLSKITRTL